PKAVLEVGSIIDAVHDDGRESGRGPPQHGAVEAVRGREAAPASPEQDTEQRRKRHDSEHSELGPHREPDVMAMKLGDVSLADVRRDNLGVGAKAGSEA